MGQKEELIKVLRELKGGNLVYFGSEVDKMVVESSPVLHKICFASREVACPPNCQLIIGDLMSLPFQSESIDVVVLNNLLYTTQERIQLLGEIKRVLTIHGKLVITELGVVSVLLSKLVWREKLNWLCFSLKHWLYQHDFVIKQEKKFPLHNTYLSKYLPTIYTCLRGAYIIVAEKRVVPITLHPNKTWAQEIIYTTPIATSNQGSEPSII